MIDVYTAQELIQQATFHPRVIDIPIEGGFDHVLAEPIVAPFHFPHFQQSAMDGYAIKGNADYYVVSGISKAGDTKQVALGKGEAYRVFTGALVPENADTVVIQEHTNVIDNRLSINKIPQRGANIRKIGEQIRKGENMLNQYAVLNPASIGLLSGFGIRRVKVFEPPVVGIIITGSELLNENEKLEKGKIYESNSIMLKSALLKCGIPKIKIYSVNDRLDLTVKAIRLALSECDVLLISGGISVGDYDFVREALDKNKVEEVFYKINQKPGKPMWFGNKEGKAVFGLPGNPASALTCFYVYVIPHLMRRRGFHNYEQKLLSEKTTGEVTNFSGKSLFLKAFVSNGEIEILGQQSSAMLASFAQANAIAIVPEHVTKIQSGECINYLAIQ